jgi:hypothetical protein
MIFHCLELWERGSITWEDALIRMAEGLETQCKLIVKENDLEEYFEKTRLSPNDKLPILEKSLIPKVDDLPSFLKQSKMVEVIWLILEFHSSILELAVTKTENEFPVMIIKKTSGFVIPGGSDD